MSGGAAWAPDGHEPVYIKGKELHIARAEVRRLGAANETPFNPIWSPDGKQIAFQGALPGKSERIYLLPSEGGTPKQLTTGESSARGDFDAA